MSDSERVAEISRLVNAQQFDLKNGEENLKFARDEVARLRVELARMQRDRDEDELHTSRALTERANEIRDLRQKLKTMQDLFTPTPTFSSRPIVGPEWRTPVFDSKAESFTFYVLRKMHDIAASNSESEPSTRSEWSRVAAYAVREILAETLLQLDKEAGPKP